MSKGKSTPGPWTASQYLDDGRWGVLTGDGGIIVSVRSAEGQLSEADARLIAKAPELLQFAKDEFESTCCTCKFLGYFGKGPTCGRCKLGALIQEAEGGE